MMLMMLMTGGRVGVDESKKARQPLLKTLSEAHDDAPGGVGGGGGGG